MLSTAQADPTPWLPLPEAADWLEGDAPEEPERANNYYRARYYDPKIGRFLSEDPIPLQQRQGRELNAYAYVANNPVNETDPFGLAIWVCNRKAETTPGGNHSYFWNDRNRTCCGMGGSGGSGSTMSCSEPGPPTDSCRKVEGSDGWEQEILRCCRGTANAGMWFPGLNDCHEAVDDCLSLLRFKNPGPPGGRFGPPCDPCQKK